MRSATLVLIAHWLSLEGTKISATGLKEVAKLKQLTRLYLRDTQTSVSGVIVFEKALAGCIFDYGEGQSVPSPTARTTKD